MTTPDRDRTAREWNARGSIFALWKDPPGQRREDYVHRSDELVMVLAGALQFEINGQIHYPAIGEELFIPSATLAKPSPIGCTGTPNLEETDDGTMYLL